MVYKPIETLKFVNLKIKFKNRRKRGRIQIKKQRNRNFPTNSCLQKKLNFDFNARTNWKDER